MQVLPDLQLPKQNKADIGNTNSESTKCSRRPDRSPCSLVWCCVQSGEAGCVKGVATCFLEVPLVGLGSMATAVQSSCLWNSGLKLHLFSRDSGKTAIRGPPKLPEGSFGGPRMAVFNQSPEEKGGVLSLYTGFARFSHHFS